MEGGIKSTQKILRYNVRSISLYYFLNLEYLNTLATYVLEENLWEKEECMGAKREWDRGQIWENL
jgi:hypothetical protein